MIQNPLYDSIHTGETSRARAWLAEHPEDFDAPIADGYSALHVACLFGEIEIAEYLLSHGAIVNRHADNASKATPLHIAACYRDEAVAARLLRLLLQNGAELNARQDGGLTALHHAVARGSVKLSEVLIQAGADPFLKDDHKRSAADLTDVLTDGAVTENLKTVLKSAFCLTKEP
jgi:ankyrin repeat protein